MTRIDAIIDEIRKELEKRPALLDINGLSALHLYMRFKGAPARRAQVPACGRGLELDPLDACSMSAQPLEHPAPHAGVALLGLEQLDQLDVSRAPTGLATRFAEATSSR